jgi:hypothetical protein
MQLHQPNPQANHSIKLSNSSTFCSVYSLNLSKLFKASLVSISFQFNSNSSSLFFSSAYFLAFSLSFNNSLTSSSIFGFISSGSFNLFSSQIGALSDNPLYFLNTKLSELNILILPEQFLLSLLIIMSQ